MITISIIMLCNDYTKDLERKIANERWVSISIYIHVYDNGCQCNAAELCMIVKGNERTVS